MGQKINNIKDLTQKVLESPELSIEVFLETMADEGLIDINNIPNSNIVKNGQVIFDIDKSDSKSLRLICPFHDTDHNGTGRINLEDQYYKCFKPGCSANKPLNVIQLYIIFKFGVDPSLVSTEENRKKYFSKAVKELADMASIPYEIGERKLSEEEKEAILINEIRNEFSDIYHEAIFKHPNNKAVLEYMLKERGFIYGEVSFKKLVKDYKIGFSPGWSYAYDLVKHKYSDEILIKAGVIRKGVNKYNKEFTCDFLSYGVVLPYFSNGKVNNLYARNLKATDKRFRHLRLRGSVDIPINFDHAKNFKSLIFVEGELSWLSMAAMGYENALGNRGTEGLGSHHIANIKSIKENSKGEKCSIIYLCFDPDKEGQTAIAKTGERLVEEGFDVRVIRLKDGDPNDFLLIHKENSRKEMDNLIKNAISYEAFMIAFTLDRSNLTSESSNADVLAALKTADKYIKKCDQLQLAVIAPDVVSYLNSKYITLDLLNMIWLGSSIIENKNNYESKAVINIDKNIETENSYKHFFVLVTDKKDRYDAIISNGGFKNAVLINNMNEFIDKVKSFEHINSLLYDNSMSEDNLNCLFNAFPEFSYRKLDCPDSNVLKTASKEKLISMISVSNIISSK